MANSNVRLIDVAKMANVSRSSVAQVLLASAGKNVGVGKKTAERIRRVAKDLNYRPNMAARQLKGIRSNIIGVIIDSYAPQIFFNRLSEMERHAAQLGYRFMIGQSHGEIDMLKNYAQDFLSYGIDGVICISHEYPEKEQKFEEIFSGFANVVYIGKPEIKNKEFAFVTVDIADGIYQGVDYLFKQSREKIGLLLWSSGTSNMKSRLSGYERAIQMNGGTVDYHLVRYIKMSDGAEFDFVNQFVHELVDKHNVDAIVAADDRVAVMAIRCLEDMGVNVPQNVAVIGVDNIELSRLCRPALTTVDQRNSELSQITVSILIDLIQGKQLPADERQVMIKPKLIIRESA